MRYSDIILTEGRDAPLYHWMDSRKARNVFRTDVLRAKFAHKIIGKKGISLTRNLRYVHHNGTAVCLVFDQARLSHTHRIIPLDGEWVAAFDRDMVPRFVDRNGFTAWKGGETAEEYVIGAIQPLHKYLRGILVKDHNDDNFIQPMLRFARRYNIPVKVLQNPSYFWANYGKRNSGDHGVNDTPRLLRSSRDDG